MHKPKGPHEVSRVSALFENILNREPKHPCNQTFKHGVGLEFISSARPLA